MKKTWILLLVASLWAPACFAQAALVGKWMVVQRNHPLANTEDGYWLGISFAEKNPGSISDGPLDEGCRFEVNSISNFLLAAPYRINESFETSPGLGDDKWHLDLLSNASAGIDLRIHCMSSRRISADYINQVMAGFFSVRK